MQVESPSKPPDQPPPAPARAAPNRRPPIPFGAVLAGTHRTGAEGKRRALRPEGAIDERPAAERRDPRRRSSDSTDGDWSLAAGPHRAMGVLIPPISSPPPPAQAAPTVHADLQTSIERFVTAMRVGRVGSSGHSVQMRVRATSGSDLEVELRHERGVITGIVRTDARAAEEAKRLANAAMSTLRAKGIVVDALEVTDL